MEYSISEILKVRENKESWQKTQKVVEIWKRKSRYNLNYSLETILQVNSEDQSWILSKEIVEISRRKTKIIY